MPNATRSEHLFEQFCGRSGIAFRRIPVAGVRTPDYELTLKGTQVLTEIKQIDPNASDRRLERRLEEEGIGHGFREELGARVRSKLSTAAGQLKQRLKPGQPGMAVIFNNVCVVRSLTDPTNMMAAMYGGHQFILSCVQHGGARLTDKRLGGKRKLTAAHNTTLSAVCVLFEGPDGPYLVAYHNHFARTPVDAEILRNSNILQFRQGVKQQGEFPQWVEV